METATKLQEAVQGKGQGGFSYAIWGRDFHMQYGAGIFICNMGQGFSYAIWGEDIDVYVASVHPVLVFPRNFCNFRILLRFCIA